MSVFYFTDVHGQKDLFIAMRDWCYKQDPNCVIIYGGDACDRGPDGYEIMKMILADDHFFYIKGNHEDMFVNAARVLLPICKNTLDMDYDKAKHIVRARSNMCQAVFDEDVYASVWNGGEDTLVKWILDGAKEDFINSIDNLHYTAQYKNIDFCHAGYFYDGFKNVFDIESHQSNGSINSFITRGLIWDRTYLADSWKHNRIAVFGHTPTQYLESIIYQKIELSKPKAWLNKIDMDTGMTFFGVGYVLDVDTMIVTGFKDSYVNQSIKLKPVEVFDQYKIEVKE